MSKNIDWWDRTRSFFFSFVMPGPPKYKKIRETRIGPGIQKEKDCVMRSKELPLPHSLRDLTDWPEFCSFIIFVYWRPVGCLLRIVRQSFFFFFPPGQPAKGCHCVVNDIELARGKKEIRMEVPWCWVFWRLVLCERKPPAWWHPASFLLYLLSCYWPIYIRD